MFAPPAIETISFSTSPVQPSSAHPSSSYTAEQPANGAAGDSPTTRR